MLASDYSRWSKLPYNFRYFSHFLSCFFAGVLLLLAFSSISLRAEDQNPFKLGPSLEEPEEKTPELDKTPFHFDQKSWNEMRRSIEGELEEIEEKVDVSTTTEAPPAPPPGQIRVELPYESSLSVTGRKVIKVEIENTHITNERAEELGTAQDTQSFNMEQELQARIQGTVARKTTINVNFDDTKDNVRDFSVVYKGDPDEVVQEAAFGDIVLSLPSTEFVNYNKQLFGIRAALKYKNAGLMAIGSRTKGNTETKRFTGTTSRQQIFINDTAFVKRKFYDLTFSRTNPMNCSTCPFGGAGTQILPISDAVPEIVYIQDNTTNPQILTRDFASSSAPASALISIPTRILSRGVDYSIDRVEGVITFTNPISEDARVAIDFTLASGQRLVDLQGFPAGADGVLIKDSKPEDDNVSQEIKRFYSAGARNIIHDNGLGNFQLRVLDKNRETDIGDTLLPIQRYPDTIEMNFETGIFELDNLLPFPEVYDANAVQGSALQAVFSLEYQAVIRTYTLRPNIVLQSEVVEVDGRRVNRDLDYFIDYDIGIITFFNDDLIRESTVIEVTYEFAPFGGQLGETLVGARGTYDILQNKTLLGMSFEKWAAGSTVLFNFAAKPTAPPDVRSTPSSLLVTEGDTQIKGLKFGNFPMTTDFAIEKARSVENPNLFGKAIVDSMEGLKQDDSSSLVEEAWTVARPPQTGSFNTVVDYRGRENAASHLRWADQDISNFDPDQTGSQKGLRVFYSLNTANATTAEQVSIINVLSRAGRDFSKKSTLEIELEGAGTEGEGVDIIVEYGSFNEDTDNDGVLDTEDTIPFDGILNLGEDIGWEFNGPGDDLSVTTLPNTSVGEGGGNARLDTEDLNRDQILSTTDLPVTLTAPLFTLSSTHTALTSTGTTASTHDLNFTGRRLFSIPLNISTLSAEEQARLTAVRQVRVTVRNNNGASVSRDGSFILARLSMVGISWEPPELEPGGIGSTMTVRAINNVDDSVYEPLFHQPAFQDLYQDSAPSGDDAREQALAIDYDLLTMSTGSTTNTYGAPRNLSEHEELKFFLSKRNTDGVCVTTNTNSCGVFFFQAGSETEYQQAMIDVTNIPVRPSWLLVTLRQADLNNDGSPETWVPDSSLVTVLRKGSAPNLSQVSQVKAGIYNPNPDSSLITIANEIWVNDIHMSDPNKRVGNAEKISFDSSWTNWMSFGGSRREVDRLFQTPTTAINNQDRTEENAYFNLDKISFLPLTYKWDRRETITPSAFQSNANALVSFLEEGKVETVNQSGTAKLIIPKLPIFDFSASQRLDENNVTQRDEETQTWRLGATYSPTLKWDLVPGKKFSFRPIPNSITTSYSRKRTDLKFPDTNTLVFFGISTSPFTSTNLTQFQEDSEARLSFNPWDGFTFNPTYKLTVNKERRDFRPEELIKAPQAGAINGLETPRSLTQTVSTSGNLRLLKWLDPRYSYSMTGTETNDLPTLTDTTGYTRKTITRTSQGELSGTIQVQQLVPKSKTLRNMTLNISYKIENGDTYQDMPEDFSWRSKLWVGTPLEFSSGTLARRTDLTDRRTFRNNVSWLPFNAYQINRLRLKPLNSLSITSNFLTSTEDTETTGTSKRVESKTFPDLILTINDSEEFFGIDKVIDASRLVFKTNRRKVETINVSRSINDTMGADYQFKFWRKLDFSTAFNVGLSRENNLVLHQLTKKTKSRSYSIQTRVPWGSWAYTPRYEKNEVDSRDSVRITDDLVAEVYSLQIYGDINRPFGVRFGRREIGFANRMILNSTLKWDKKRSDVNPQTNYLDVYSASLSGDYTISKNFRMAIGGNFSQEVHHPEFDKLDKVTFSINSTLTIQF